MLAEHRCEETINEVCLNFNNQIYEIIALIENDEFEKSIELLKYSSKEIFKIYSEKLSRYPSNIVQSKNETLLLRLKELIEPIFNIYCEKIEKKSIKIFEHVLLSSKNTAFTTELINDSIERSTTFYRTSLLRKFSKQLFA